jgi:cation:H+ antiporter
MHLDARQCEEIFLTAAQSLLAIVVLANLQFGLGEAVLLMSLFLVQFVFPTTEVRLLLGVGYLVIAGGYLASRTARHSLAALFRA